MIYPSDWIPREEAKREAKNIDHSFYRVILPEIDITDHHE